MGEGLEAGGVRGDGRGELHGARPRTAKRYLQTVLCGSCGRGRLRVGRHERLSGRRCGAGRLRAGHGLPPGPDHARRAPPGARPGRGEAVAGGAGPLPAGGRAGLPVGQPQPDRAQAARAGGRALGGSARPGPRQPQLELRPRPRRARPGARHRAAPGGLPGAAYADYDKGITCRRSSTCPSGEVVTNDFPWITHDLFFEWTEHHRPDAPDLWPADLRDEMDAGDGAGLHRRQQRRLPVRVRGLAAGVRRGVRRGCGRRWTGWRSG